MLLRLFTEGVVIVLSILLAFWIDASWELHRERDQALEHLQLVRDELVGNLDVLEEGAQQCEDGAAHVIRHLLTLMGPEPTMVPVDSLAHLVASSLRGNAPPLRTSAFDAFLSSGTPGEVASLPLQEELRRWQGTIEVRRERVQITSDEIAKTIEYLVSIGAQARINDASRVNLPPSRFSFDVKALLSDAVFASTIGSLGVRRDQVCMDDANRRKPRAQALIDLISAELDR